MPQRLAIIPARGGSKRIPRKNIRVFCGEPIINYPIRAAIDSNLFDEVIVSTDDDEIAKLAIDRGAKVPFKRSKKNSNDFATTSDVLREVLAKYEDCDEFCCLYPTAPFVTAEKLIQAYDLLKDRQGDSLVSIVKFSFPPQRGLIADNDRVAFQFPEFSQKRSQDLKEIYHDSGQFYWAKVASFLNTGELVGKNCIGFELDPMQVQDIDNEKDWKLAELKFQLLNKK